VAKYKHSKQDTSTAGKTKATSTVCRTQAKQAGHKHSRQGTSTAGRTQAQEARHKPQAQHAGCTHSRQDTSTAGETHEQQAVHKKSEHADKQAGTECKHKLSLPSNTHRKGRYRNRHNSHMTHKQAVLTARQDMCVN
jgi:hypothetical protein